MESNDKLMNRTSDGAPCHKAKIVNEWKQKQGIRTRVCPLRSPCLNPIENLWWDIKKGVWVLRSRNVNELASSQCETMLQPYSTSKM